MRVLAAAYTVLAIAASARATVQLSTRAGDAPLPYALSALAAFVYVVLALTVSRPRWHRIALLAACAELSGALLVGTAEHLSATAWPDETVWSRFGAGYAWAPLVLPVATLVAVTRRRDRSLAPGHRMQAGRPIAAGYRPGDRNQPKRGASVPHIDLPEGVPGIRSAMMFRPATAAPLLQLAEVLLRDENTLSRGERELIAAYVSNLNDCSFCQMSHSTFAALQLDGGMTLVDQVKRDPATAPVSDKLRALLAIAAKVREDGRAVTQNDVTAAREHGATDTEIHDTVLIAAAFSMYNRYVDGLATLTPTDPAAYEEMGSRIVQHGYISPAVP